jgi:hypothetical protein
MAMIVNANVSQSPRTRAVTAWQALKTALEELAYCDDWLTDNTDTAVIEGAFGLAEGQGAAFKALLQAANNTAKGNGTKNFIKQFVP